MPTYAWCTDPGLAGRFHTDYPDDLQVLVHDGEPRRTGRQPEGCWVGVDAVHGPLKMPMVPADAGLPIAPDLITWTERPVYRGVLLNEPLHLQSVVEGR